MTSPPLRSRWVVVGHWRLHAIVSSSDATTDRPPIVLVAGLGLSNRYLRPTIELLAQDHEVHTPDLPGCGRSSRPDRPLHPSELADAVLGWMDAVDLDRAVLVGHSVGCQVIVHLAKRHPDRVSSLVLASPTGDPTIPRWRQAMLLLGDTAREPPSLAPLAIRDYLRAGPLRMWRTLGLAHDDDTVARLRRLRHRSLVVRGGHDAVVSAEWTRDVAEAVRAERLVTIPQAPHGLPYSAAPDLVRAINTFLGSSPNL